MDFPNHFLTNQLFIQCFTKKNSSSSNISCFNMLKNIFLVNLGEKFQGDTYRYTITGLDDIRPLTPLLVYLISFNSSILFLVSLI